MTTKIFSTVIIIIGSLFASTVAQAAEPSSQGLTLTLTFDRETYLEHEPIFAEWTFSNRGKAAVNLPLTDDEILISFHGRNAQGKILTGHFPLTVSFGSPPVPRKFKPGETEKW